MENRKGRNRPHRTPGGSRHRQLTIGECIAIGRYAPHWHEPGATVDLDDVLRMIDYMKVCTTCGWPVDRHGCEERTARLLNICAQWTRE